MSIMSSLFFILLCFSFMHANSEARYIGLGRSPRALFPHSDKGQFLSVVEKLRLGMGSSTTKGSVLVKQQDDETTGEQKGTHGGAVVSGITTTKGTKDYTRTSTTTKSDVVVPADVKPRVSSTWYMPLQIKNRNKIINHGDRSSKNPGIYSDYSRPRTRPPSHN